MGRRVVIRGIRQMVPKFRTRRRPPLGIVFPCARDRSYYSYFLSNRATHVREFEQTKHWATTKSFVRFRERVRSSSFFFPRLSAVFLSAAHLTLAILIVTAAIHQGPFFPATHLRKKLSRDTELSPCAALALTLFPRVHEIFFLSGLIPQTFTRRKKELSRFVGSAV